MKDFFWVFLLRSICISSHNIIINLLFLQFLKICATLNLIYLLAMYYMDGWSSILSFQRTLFETKALKKSQIFKFSQIKIFNRQVFTLRHGNHILMLQPWKQKLEFLLLSGKNQLSKINSEFSKTASTYMYYMVTNKFCPLLGCVTSFKTFPLIKFFDIPTGQHPEFHKTTPNT